MTTTLRTALLNRIVALSAAQAAAPKINMVATVELEAALADVTAGRLDAARARLASLKGA